MPQPAPISKRFPGAVCVAHYVTVVLTIDVKYALFKGRESLTDSLSYVALWTVIKHILHLSPTRLLRVSRTSSVASVSSNVEIKYITEPVASRSKATLGSRGPYIPFFMVVQT